MASGGKGGRGPFDFEPGRAPQIPKINLPKFSSGAIRALGIGLAALIVLWSGVYQIDPEEAGLVRRFGAYVRETGPGLHVKIPFVETVTKLPVQRQLKEEFGFRTIEPGVRSEFRAGEPFYDESLMLTGDLNVAVVEWIVQYKIADPRAFLFNVRDVRSTFRDMTEAVMREVVGDHGVDEVITIGRARMSALAKEKLQELCDRYEIGISVQQLVLQDVNPPDAVKPSFNEVNQAIQERERLINEAWAEYNQTIPKARGEAQRTIEEAEGYATERVNRAEGEAARFNSIYTEYSKAPRVTRNRMYLETLNEVLPRLGKKVILDEKGSGVLPLLNLTERAQEVKQ